MTENSEQIINLRNTPIVCINLKHRKDRRAYVKKLFQKKNIYNYSFYTAELHEEPRRGCLESHLNIIREHRSKGTDYILIVEDDIKILNFPDVLTDIPSDWDMLYLGGNVKRIVNSYNDKWKKVQSWCTHAYLINLKNKTFMKSVLKLWKNTDNTPIDNLYINKINTNYNCYMISPMMIVQREDYSDIEKKQVNYDHISGTILGFDTPENDVDDETYVLKLPNIPDEELPYISIVTPTYRRRKLFSMAIRNFQNFIYPKEKIEWVIVEDTEDDNMTVEDMLPYSNRIKYIRIKDKEMRTPIPIGAKRNLCVEKAKHDIIIHMDDDDYYPAESLLAKVKLLIKYPGKDCIGSSNICTYDIINDKCTYSSDSTISLSEASLAYRKSFWKKQKFNDNAHVGEFKQFIANRTEKILDIPYIFTVFALTHKSNLTGSLRETKENALTYKKTKKEVNFKDFLDEDTQDFIQDLRTLLLKN